jgi:hypothetical protein
VPVEIGIVVGNRTRSNVPPLGPLAGGC